MSRAKLRIFSEPTALGLAVAGDILHGICSVDGGGDYVVGIPSGRTAIPVLRALARLAHGCSAPWEKLTVVMWDAYVTAADGCTAVLGPEHKHSCIRFALDHIVAPINVATRTRAVTIDQVEVPDPSDPLALELRLARSGGIDLAILASGTTDGHIGFNPPGAGIESRTRIVVLPESTRRDNLATYPHLQAVSDVPTVGITLGIATIAQLSRRSYLLLHGSEKSIALSRVMSVNTYDPAWPSSVIHSCRDSAILTDVECVRSIAIVERSRD